VNLLASKVNCAVLNAGDGRHEHPTQALAGCADDPARQGPHPAADRGDLRRHRAFPRGAVNLILLGKMENRIRLIGPPR
jgi:aspartate carbamoyltransferase catalytic subunit